MRYQELLETLKNAAGVANWEHEKAIEKAAGGNPDAYETLSSMLNLGTRDLPGGFAGAIKAWHGSPHLYRQVDHSYMGAGEGNQGYGWGGYSGVKPVAQEYRDTLWKKQLKDSKAIAEAGNIAGIRDDLLIYLQEERWRKRNSMPSRTYDDYIKETVADVYDDRPAPDVSWKEFTKGRRFFLPDSLKKAIDEAPGTFPEFVHSLPRPDELLAGKRRGYMYELSHEWPDAARETTDPLTADKHLLDAEKTVRDQPAYVLEQLKKHFPEETAESMDNYGSNIYVMLKQKLGSDKAASEALWNAGIPGHRYANGFTRNNTADQHNYVMYSDKIPKVQSIEGVPVDEIDWTDPTAFMEKRKLGRVK